MKLMKNNNQISIYIVDYDPLVLCGLKSIINMENDLQVCGEAVEIKKAIKDIKLLNPNL